MLAKVHNIKINRKHILRYVKHPHHIYKNYLLWKRASVINNKFVFVIGAPRSGTTLLQRIINTHSEFVGFDYETDVFSPKDIFDYTRFEQFLDLETYKQAIQISDDICQFFLNIHMLSLNVENKMIIEKTPQHFKQLPFLISKFVNSKFIFIVRDVRDCYCSAFESKNIPQSQNLLSFIHYWNLSISKRLLVKSDRVYDLKYEDLVNNPGNEIVKIMSFLDRQFEENQLSPEHIGQDERSYTHEFKRLKSPISNKTVGRWKSLLNDEEKDLFIKIAGENLLKYDYLTK